MTFTQKYCIVHLFTPLPDGFTFSASEWPPHCTLAGVFALDWTDELREEFRRLIGEQLLVTSELTKEDFFGPDQSIHVRLLQPNKPLTNLHLEIANFIEQHGGRFNEPHYAKIGFKPHITVTTNDALSNGSLVTVTDLSLIDMFPDGDHTMRRVLETTSLKRFFKSNSIPS